jgi:hypothetical protein
MHHDPPWKTGPDIESYLKSIEGVSTVRYIDPFEGYYGPPAWSVRTKDGQTDSVVESIREYYDGFSMEKVNGVLRVALEYNH